MDFKTVLLLTILFVVASGYGVGTREKIRKYLSKANSGSTGNAGDGMVFHRKRERDLPDIDPKKYADEGYHKEIDRVTRLELDREKVETTNCCNCDTGSKEFYEDSYEMITIRRYKDGDADLDMEVDPSKYKTTEEFHNEISRILDLIERQDKELRCCPCGPDQKKPENRAAGKKKYPKHLSWLADYVSVVLL